MTPNSKSLLLVLAGLALLSLQAWGGELRGCWLVPESIFDDDRTYSLRERRQRISGALDRMKGRGIDSVFVESFVRGHATSRATAASNPVPVPARYLPAVRTEPDLLDLFIEEGRTRGMRIHAWIHVCYLRSDSITRSREDDDTPTLFQDLMATEFRAVRERTAAGSRARTAVDAVLESLERGFEMRALSDRLREAGFGLTHTPMETVIELLAQSGIPGPALFVYGPRGQLHSELDSAPNGSIYVDSAHAQVRARLLDMMQSLVEEHPGLAGLHLDHVRYPEGDFGYDAQASDGQVRWVAPEPGARERAISSLVADCRSRLAGKAELSAAVVPGYYLGWPGSGGTQRGAAQDWFSWGLDFYVPMLYAISGDKLANAMASYRRGLHGSAPVYPGIGSLGSGRGGSWILFDYGKLK
ncbi:MAG: hypothetical protein HY814_09620 [Candidatus Riflebacteria bacterium]|nr:hypothetical protein [Candidatus Riflebacteria bacterium]